MKFYTTTVILALFVASSFGCSPPPQPKAPGSPAVDTRIVDPSMKGEFATSDASKMSMGNIWIELQEDTASKKQTLFLKAAFHEPMSKNVFLESLPPEVPEDDHGHEEKPKPGEEEKKVKEPENDQKSPQKQENESAPPKAEKEDDTKKHSDDGHDHKNENP